MGWDWLLDELDAREESEIPDEDDYKMDDILDDEEDEGEGWKKSTGYETYEFDSVKNLPVYKKSFQYGLDAVRLVGEIAKKRQDAVLSNFVEGATVPGAKISGGFAMGFDMHSLGGNIANCKRGLAAARRALNALDIMLEEGIIDRKVHADFYQRGKEVRDELEEYIIELRRRFERGIE